VGAFSVTPTGQETPLTLHKCKPAELYSPARVIQGEIFMAKRPKRPSGRGVVKFLRDSGQCRTEINRGKRDLRQAPNPEAESRAVARIQAAESSLMQISAARFEKLADEKGRTAMRAMDDLVRLTQQKRYACIITEHHEQIICSQLQTRFEAVQRALRATIESQAAKSMVGVFVEVSMFRQINQAPAAAE